MKVAAFRRRFHSAEQARSALVSFTGDMLPLDVAARPCRMGHHWGLYAALPNGVHEAT